jgi:hypothetical protein
MLLELSVWGLSRSAERLSGSGGMEWSAVIGLVGVLPHKLQTARGASPTFRHAPPQQSQNE